MARDEHPDRAWGRHQELADEQLSRERREDRLADYTPREPAVHLHANCTQTSRAGEHPCPHCGRGAFTVRDNSDAPIPIRVPDSVHDDEGRSVSFCPWCDEELDAEQLLEASARGAWL